MNYMAKVQIKSENLSRSGEIISIMERICLYPNYNNAV